MCDKAVNSHPCTMQFVPECYKSQEMCDKAVNRSFFVFNSIPDHYKTQEICDIIVYFYSFLKIYYPDKHKTQKMCNEAVDDCLAALKFITDWFVTSKMLGKFDNTLHANDDILFYNEDCYKVTFIANQKHILAVDLEKINLDNNFGEDDPDAIIRIRFLAWRSKFKRCKAFKKV